MRASAALLRQGQALLATCPRSAHVLGSGYLVLGLYRALGVYNSGARVGFALLLPDRCPLLTLRLPHVADATGETI